MADSPKIPLKNPQVAAVLSFLIPGLGHFYQRRIFKGCVYSICILSTFFAGMYLGNWKVVYFNWGKRDRILAPICQVWAGLPFLPAIIQGRRAAAIEKAIGDPDHLQKPAEGRFVGDLSKSNHGRQVEGEVVGHLEITPVGDGFSRSFTGRFEGTLAGKYSIQGEVVEGLGIQRRIAPFDEREVAFILSGQVTIDEETLDFRATVEGGLQRSFLDWYAAPLHDTKDLHSGEPTDLERAHDELGQYFDLGTLYTMVAGLLNILAIYDALEGPAYGSGEEDDSEDDDSDKQPEAKKT